jgi:hypothetical protein
MSSSASARCASPLGLLRQSLAQWPYLSQRLHWSRLVTGPPPESVLPSFHDPELDPLPLSRARPRPWPPCFLLLELPELLLALLTTDSRNFSLAIHSSS